MNLIYINTHDTGRCIHAYGYNVNTPNYDAFAKDSCLFTHAYSVAPTCSPSRAGLLTGQYPHSNGMLGLAHRGFNITDPTHHLAHFLKDNGYKTVISGMQHECGLAKDVEGLHKLGYEEILTCDLKETDHIWDKQNAINAVNFLDNYKSDKPFYLAYGMSLTHRPYPQKASNIDEDLVKPNFPGINTKETRMDEARFMTAVQYADENVGMIIDALKRNHLYEDSIILVTTDHGVANPYQKCHLNDFGTGVYLMLHIPHHKPEVIDHIVSHIDIFPAICDLLHLNKPAYLEGHSLLSNTKDEYVYAEINFHTSYEPARSIRNERYKFIKYFDETYLKENISNIDESIQKTILMNNGLTSKLKYKEALYDTYYDPSETHNVINDSEYEDVLNTLRNALYDHMKQTNDPLLKGELKRPSHSKINTRQCILPESNDPNDYEITD